MGKRHSRGEWITICAAFERGGETVADFARRRGVHPATLGWWRTKLRREGMLGASRNTFVEVVQAHPAAAMHTMVRIGKVTVDFGEGLPPVAWLADACGRTQRVQRTPVCVRVAASRQSEDSDVGARRFRALVQALGAWPFSSADDRGGCAAGAFGGRPVDDAARRHRPSQRATTQALDATRDRHARRAVIYKGR